MSRTRKERRESCPPPTPSRPCFAAIVFPRADCEVFSVQLLFLLLLLRGAILRGGLGWVGGEEKEQAGASTHTTTRRTSLASLSPSLSSPHQSGPLNTPTVTRTPKYRRILFATTTTTASLPLTTMAPSRSSPPGSPSSQMSAPMEESDSDSDAPQNRGHGADDDMPYPVDYLFKSHEEKARIMSMREIEREQILADRREENERTRQNRVLRQLKVNQEKDSKKRKASAADLEDASRKSARARTKGGEGVDKMDSLRRAREERSNRKEQRERENDRRRQRSSSYRRSHSPDGHDSDGDWRRDSRQKSRSPEPRETPPAELRDVERIRLGRTRFAEVCSYPGFEKAITGCYVRINIGPDPSTRQEVYRMAVIKGIFSPLVGRVLPNGPTNSLVQVSPPAGLTP